MNYYYITGTSSGIGKALAELYLRDKNNFVYGLSRTQSITHENYKHCKIDLNNVDEVNNFKFEKFDNADSIVLVSNATMNSTITHFGKLNEQDMIQRYNVDIVSPSIIMNHFLKAYQNSNCKRVIMNISSGAARRPIGSWSLYCAAKASMAMLCEVIDIEQKHYFPDNPVKIFSVSPGIVDTKAQDNIRKANPEDFSDLGMFIEFKEKNQLADPKDVAEKLAEIINTPEKFDKVSLDVREM
ncbi:MAG: SDR family NAD(P)-dependent oxidoreductase [bacterium]|nr:SDR family NAD(P)-dependent oxidoreductase [bacterium]